MTLLCHCNYAKVINHLERVAHYQAGPISLQVLSGLRSGREQSISPNK